jgi:hypothetical protein
MNEDGLDELDQAIVYRLQQNARKTSASTIAVSVERATARPNSVISVVSVAVSAGCPRDSAIVGVGDTVGVGVGGGVGVWVGVSVGGGVD